MVQKGSGKIEVQVQAEVQRQPEIYQKRSPGKRQSPNKQSIRINERPGTLQTNPIIGQGYSVRGTLLVKLWRQR